MGVSHDTLSQTAAICYYSGGSQLDLSGLANGTRGLIGSITLQSGKAGVGTTAALLDNTLSNGIESTIKTMRRMATTEVGRIELGHVNNVVSKLLEGGARDEMRMMELMMIQDLSRILGE